MSDEQTGQADSASDTGDSTAGDEAGQRRKSVGDGIKEGLGVLSAFKDALEETIQEARERGDLSSERAREVMKETLGKAQSAAEGARGKLDFATQADLEAVLDAVDGMKDRLSALEQSVFGASKGDGAEEAGAGSDDHAEGASGV